MIPACLEAASIEASPIATTPRMFMQELSPDLIVGPAVSEVAAVGPLTDVKIIPLPTGLWTPAQRWDQG